MKIGTIISLTKLAFENPLRFRNEIKQLWLEISRPLRRRISPRQFAVYKKSIPYWKQACDGNLDAQMARKRGFDL